LSGDDEDIGNDAPLDVESSIAPPLINCPNCDGLLPLGLGEKTCTLCEAVVLVDHEATRKEWMDEMVACPSCSKVLVCGVDDRPATVACSSCANQFIINPKVVKVEISCPACERRLRLKPRPGSRQIICPACEESFKVTF
jgi:DNA-directed RNA polymerase subunit RPC12/RpoP